ncbi:hypothetical protein CEXT_64531 [Caerostris extrusa]|uniref:Uncharacterized protein n=1 Tax=Caerostris extrusa TaxID=172846 RepID=A0AAV4R2T4_CAEEX|nr:hypothetical protein CEXT_64531 [Caerostris extrusa]
MCPDQILMLEGVFEKFPFLGKEVSFCETGCRKCSEEKQVIRLESERFSHFYIIAGSHLQIRKCTQHFTNEESHKRERTFHPSAPALSPTKESPRTKCNRNRTRHLGRVGGEECAV